MNTSQIKNFAIQSRNILKTGVIQRIQILGFDSNGNLTKGEPTRIDIQGGATLFAGEIYGGPFYDRWMSLRSRIQEKGVKEVYEEAAYTWFNRLVAIRIMQKNGFIDPVLAYTNEQTRIPRIVAEARAGRVGQMTPADRKKLRDLMGDDARINEQFAILIENFCRNNPVIFNCFGGIEEYISLLLPDNILAPGGFIDLLNHTSYITEDDYKQSELIGWLYQFYISERKDEVFENFKKGKKAESDDIPAATQIFTPNWIVKYMVQNTLGRIYLDNNPYSELKAQMHYLVEPTKPMPKEVVLKLEDLSEYTLLDPACGSGHILLEGFELLYKMYLKEAYSSRIAIENIFLKNLIGIDIDTRAKQLATFALLMKAAHIDPSFLDCKVMPSVLDMPGSTFSRPLLELLHEFYMSDDKVLIQETYDALSLLRQAHNLGSIIKFNLSKKTRKEMELRYKEWNDTNSSFEILPSVRIILALTASYSAIAMNPPYMGSGNMNESLSAYTKSYYDESKADLATVFVERVRNLSQPKGLYAFIIPPSWMFLPSFEKMRKRIIEEQSIQSFLQLSNGAFGGDFGSTPCVILNYENQEQCGEYFRVVEKTFQLIDSNDLRELFLSSLNNESFRFKFSDYERGQIHHDPDGRQLRYRGIKQKSFLSLPGAPIAYWLSEPVLELFKNETIKQYSISDGQTKTGDNNKYLRYIWEVSNAKVGRDRKWVKHPKGGAYRRWAGNIEWIVDWSEEARDFYRKDRVARILPEYLWWKKGISWTLLTSGIQGYRDYPDDCIFNIAAPTLFFTDESIRIYVLGLLNTPISVKLIEVFNPTINNNIGDIQSIPLVIKNKETICGIVSNNIALSYKDWDAHETSWGFKENELIRIYKDNHSPEANLDANQLKNLVVLYKEYWTAQFNQLHENEEELNRHFIEIYRLQDELTPDVPLDEITILQQGEISVEDGQLVWHNDVLAKQLLSYAIGCVMGRYRLDRPGLHIAYPNPSAADVEAYDFQGEKFEIDDDGIIPLLGRDCPFDDNAYNRVVKFIRQVFGESFLNENLNFIEDALGKTIENYFVKDFWKDHKKMYSNRPIYWLFSSKKGAFQCLTYMHRMNPYTAEIVRSKYLLPYIDFLKNKVKADMDRASTLSTVERRQLDKMQIALDECLEYEERLHDVADQQIHFDLDDGVIVNYAKFGDVLAKIK